MNPLADAADQMIPLAPLLLTLFSLGMMVVVMVMMGLKGLRGTIKPNRFFGIRTKYTFSSDFAWYTVHELAGRWSVAAGLVVLPALVLVPVATTPNAQLAALLVPVGLCLALLFVGMWKAHRISREREAALAGRADRP